MFIVKEGGHRLFENDPETSKVVSEMLSDLERHGLDAVRRYSGKFDDWNPTDFELSPKQIREAIGKLDAAVIRDTTYCQDNVRRFAQAQKETLLPLETQPRPGIVLGHPRRGVGLGDVGATAGRLQPGLAAARA